MTPANAFDILATTYDRAWTCAPAGRLQREAFWRHAGGYLRHATRVLDIGCGTGEDAVRLMRAGVQVTAIDVSPRMVATARARGVHAHVQAAEELDGVEGWFEAAISNFGALNCVRDLRSVVKSLARVIAPGGYAILCVFGRCCVWELAWYAGRGEWRKARRRWRREASGGPGVRVFYHAVRDIERCFAPEFRLVKRVGIGVLVPPSYVHCRSTRILRRAAWVDEKLGAVPGFRAAADHTLLVFQRR